MFILKPIYEQCYGVELYNYSHKEGQTYIGQFICPIAALIAVGVDNGAFIKVMGNACTNPTYINN